MRVPTDTAVAEPTVETIAAAPLTLLDRCDRCDAQAFVRVALSSLEGRRSELLFCGHHYAKHEPALRDRVTVTSIQDERHLINSKSASSA